MAEEYFVCDPVNLCEGASCCISPESNPSMTTADYVRLSDRLGQPIEQVWRDVGDTALNNNPDIGLRPGQFIVSLGLLHDPCPYLTDNLQCDVHDYRPIECAAFPHMNLNEDDESLRNRFADPRKYGCLQNVTLSPEQVQFASDIGKFFRETALFDIQYLWDGGLPQIYTPSLLDAVPYAESALERQQERDPEGISPRSVRLMEAVDTLYTPKIMADEHGKEGIDPLDFEQYMKTIMFAILEDKIAERLAGLEMIALKQMRDLNKRFEELVRKQKQIGHPSLPVIS